MKTKTYLLNNNFDSEYSDGASAVRFTLDELDVVSIRLHAEYVRNHNLLCVETMDERCSFRDEIDDDEPSDFRQEAPRMAIFGDYINFMRSTARPIHSGTPIG